MARAPAGTDGRRIHGDDVPPVTRTIAPVTPMRATTPNSVPTTRAHGLPASLLTAIHHHSATPTSDRVIDWPTSRPSSWARTAATSSNGDRTAPTYISRTASRTLSGGRGATGERRRSA